MSRSMRIDRRLAQDVADLESEEGLPLGRITVPKNRRGKSSTANFRAGRGGRGSAKVKRFRGRSDRANCVLRRR